MDKFNKKLVKDIYARQVELTMLFSQVVSCLEAQEKSFKSASEDFYHGTFCEISAELLKEVREKEEKIRDVQINLMQTLKATLDVMPDEE